MVIVSRVSRLEMLDEVEELDLVLGHYAISWGILQLGNEWGREWLEWGIKISCRQDDEH
jgi:[phosphatase 2A protein]-leucine-carboxy methyltransferase